MFFKSIFIAPYIFIALSSPFLPIDNDLRFAIIMGCAAAVFMVLAPRRERGRDL